MQASSNLTHQRANAGSAGPGGGEEGHETALAPVVLDQLTECLSPFGRQRQAATGCGVGQHERAHSLGMCRRVHGAEAWLDLGDQCHPVHTCRLEHRLQVVHLLFECERSVERVRQPRAAAIEVHEACERADPLVGAEHPGVLEDDVEMGRRAADEHHVGRALTHHPESDLGVARARITHRRHGLARM